MGIPYLNDSNYRIYPNKRRIWDKVNKRRPRISAAPPMRRLLEEFGITWKNTKLFHNDKGVRSHR